MSSVVTKASLSPQRRRLVEILQGLNFGSVEGLHVRDGEPVFTPPPRVIREIKLGGMNGPRPEMAKDDFALKSDLCQFLAQIEVMRNGTILSLEVKHGLPFLMRVEEVIA